MANSCALGSPKRARIFFLNSASLFSIPDSRSKNLTKNTSAFALKNQDNSLRREFYSLRLSPRKICCRLTQLHIRKPHLGQSIYFSTHLRNVLEKFKRFFNRHIKNLGNIFLVVVYCQRLLIVPRAFAFFALHINVGQKMHFYLFYPLTLAFFASPPFDVKTEPA